MDLNKYQIKQSIARWWAMSQLERERATYGEDGRKEKDRIKPIQES